MFAYNDAKEQTPPLKGVWFVFFTAGVIAGLEVSGVSLSGVLAPLIR